MVFWAWMAGCAWVSPTEEIQRWDVDGDGVERPLDCDDRDGAVQGRTWFADLDGDGQGDPEQRFEGCVAPDNHVPNAEDCDDSDARVAVGAPERCNSIDDDCDGVVDEGIAVMAFHRDADGDGFGNPDDSVEACTAPAKYVANDHDCDDGDDAVHPDADELCNGIDDDCDDLLDSLDPSLVVGQATWYADVDQDGYGDDANTLITCEAPSGWVQEGGDCNDASAALSPGVDELCNAIDDDCDGDVDEDGAADAPTWFPDLDGDGYGDSFSPVVACSRPADHTDVPFDCDDGDADRNPLAAELCNGIDDNCNGVDDANDPFVADPTTWYADDDGDGFGTTTIRAIGCEQPASTATNSADCSDTQPDINPAALEICDDVDNDCDGDIDQLDDDVIGQPWYFDADKDGYGVTALVTVACDPPIGFVANGGDCDDDDPALSPGAGELCNLIDDDCDGLVDEDTPSVWNFDADGDGFGDPALSLEICTPPPGYVFDATDCDDASDAIHPAADEICNAIDDDCDGFTDDADVDVLGLPWHADVDDDAYGDPFTLLLACVAPTGWVADATDCNDGHDTINPGEDEVCDDADNDCDGGLDDADPEGPIDAPEWYRDVDVDGYGDPDASVAACLQPIGYRSNDRDCDDDHVLISPIAQEVCDAVDNDCDGLLDGDDPSVDLASQREFYFDDDGDGFGDSSQTSGLTCSAPADHVPEAGDCDDAAATVFPGAPELCDALDNDCDTLVDEGVPTTWFDDLDGDGFGAGSGVATCTPTSGQVANAADCDDDAVAVNPAADEVCNGDDDDCDGLVDDADPSSVGLAWYPDQDDDGYGNANTILTACTAPTGWVLDATDCNDASDAAWPGADEVCDGIDNDCDGLADDADPGVSGSNWWPDLDGDGYGQIGAPVNQCTAPPSSAAWGGDCDDTDFDTKPGGVVVPADGIDNDCSGFEECFYDQDQDGVGVDTLLIDDDGDRLCDDPGEAAVAGDCDDTDDQIQLPTWYRDDDNDGWGDAAKALAVCTLPLGYSASPDDCDDDDQLVNPGATEVCDDGVDNDCDGMAGPACSTPNIDVEHHQPRIERQSAEPFGAVVASGLDFDGDGLEDVLVGSPDVGDGQLTIVPGAGLSGVSSALDFVTLDGNGNEELGAHIVGADVDGDGTPDAVVGAPGQSSGRVYVWFDTGSVQANTPATILNGGALDNEFGASFDVIADRTGDGIPDWIIGSPKYDDLGSNDAGRAIFVPGPLDFGTVDLHGTAAWVGEGGGDKAGLQASGVGDVDGDGLEDIAIGAWHHDGPPNHVGAAYLVTDPGVGAFDLASADGKVQGPGSHDHLGEMVVGDGDVDDDGRAEWLVGSADIDGLGRAWLVGDLTAVSSDDPDDHAVASFVGTRPDGQFGLAGALMDHDGDGEVDVVLSAPEADGLKGAVYVFHGPVSGDLTADDADRRFYSSEQNLLGTSLAPADVNGDGTLDFAAAAPGVGGDGGIYVFFGADGL